MKMETNISPEVKFEQDTREHVNKVRTNLNLVIKDLIDRAAVHDESKWSDKERALFIEYTPKLAGMTYGSPEYDQALKDLKPALDNHYKLNDHHINHFPDGVKSMNLIQLIEMAADWYAAAMRHNDGDPYKSIDINQKRFGYGEEMAAILRNTVAFFNSK